MRLHAFATALMNGEPTPYRRGPVADTIDGWERPGNRALMADAAKQLEVGAALGVTVPATNAPADLEWMDWAEGVTLDELAEEEAEEPP